MPKSLDASGPRDTHLPIGEWRIGVRYRADGDPSACPVPPLPQEFPEVTYGKFFASTFTGSMAGAGSAVFAVWGYCLANSSGGQVDLNPLVVSALIGCERAEVERAIQYLCSPDPNSRSKQSEGRRIVHLTGVVYEIVNHSAYRALATQESVREYHRDRKRAQRSVQGCPGLSRENSASASASGILDLGSDPDAREPVATGSFPAVLRTLPEGYTPSPSLLAQVASAGCPREVFEARLAELRTGPIGGSRGVLPNQLEKYLLTQASKWRNWNAADVAKQANGRPRRDAPNQPNAGITGLEKAKVVR